MCLSPLPDDELPSPAAPKAPVLPPGVPLAGRVEEVPITAGRTGLVVVIVGVPAVVVVSTVVVVPAVVVVSTVVVVSAVVVIVTAVVVASAIIVAALSHGGERHCRQQR